MRYIDSWLTGLGLEYIIPKLKSNGITTPKKLAQLTLRDMYEVVGVEDAEDRKKLYFLIQRLQTILNNKGENAQQNSPGAKSGDGDEDDRSFKSKVKSQPSIVPESIPVASAAPGGRDEDLRLLRRSRRNSCEVDLTPSNKADGTTASNALKSLKSKAQSAQNLLGSVSSDAVGAMQYRGPVAGFSKPPPKLDYATSMAEEDESEEEPPQPQRRHQTQAAAPMLTRARSVLTNYSAEDKSSSTSSRANGSNSSSSAAGASLGSRSSDPSHRGPRSPVRQAPPLQRVAQQTYEDDSEDPFSEPHHRHQYEQSPPEGLRNMRLAPPPPQQPQPVKSLRRQNEAPPAPQEEEEPPVIEDMAIRVVVRKRPLSKSELGRGEKDVMEVRRGGTVLLHEPKTKVDLTKVVETQSFVFDDAFEAHETNELIYSRTIKQLVHFVFDGGKASCFAYGQTGSGKTFSMMGSRPDAPAEAKVNAGLYVLAARDIFRILVQPKYKHLHVLVSCFEIYGGKLFDLLNERSVVKCLEDAKQQVQLPGLSEHGVNNVAELLNLMAMAHMQRSTGSTGANAESSRSHQIMQIVLRNYSAASTGSSKDNMKKRVAAAFGANSAPSSTLEGKLSFIDLAGSERGADTTHSSKQTRMEGAEINTSLLALKEVIRSLERKQGHTPFRGSKLTQVLKDSFVGDKTRTCMVACVSPSHTNCEHTLNTLRYADRVKEHNTASSGDGPAPASAAPHGSSSNYDSMAYDCGPRPAAGSKPQAGSAKVLKSVPSRQQNGGAVYGDENRDSSQANAIRPPPSAPSSGKQPSRPSTALPPSEAAYKAAVPRPSSALPASSSSRLACRSLDPHPADSDDLDEGRRHTMVGRAPQGRRHVEDFEPEEDEEEEEYGLRPPASRLPLSSRSSGPQHQADHRKQAEEPPRKHHHHQQQQQQQNHHHQQQQQQRRRKGSERDRDRDSESDADSGFGSTELIHKTLGLLSAHKQSIAEMVEVMKDEMELVQEMENVEDRNSEEYIDKLESILDVKSSAISLLRNELYSFQQYRSIVTSL